MKDTLEKLNGTPERAGYILMDVIQPPLIRNCVIRPGMKPFMDDTVSELGIFGVVIGYQLLYYFIFSFLMFCCDMSTLSLTLKTYFYEASKSK